MTSNLCSSRMARPHKIAFLQIQPSLQLCFMNLTSHLQGSQFQIDSVGIFFFIFYDLSFNRKASEWKMAISTSELCFSKLVKDSHRTARKQIPGRLLCGFSETYIIMKIYQPSLLGYMGNTLESSGLCHILTVKSYLHWW